MKNHYWPIKNKMGIVFVIIAVTAFVYSAIGIYGMNAH
jgi:hypothetical protein